LRFDRNDDNRAKIRNWIDQYLNNDPPEAGHHSKLHILRLLGEQPFFPLFDACHNFISPRSSALVVSGRAKDYSAAICLKC